jgi:uncharacterized membrane protein YfcA
MSDLLQQMLVFPLIGAVSGALAGLFGIGGGLVMVPALYYVFSTADMGVPESARMHFSIGSSLAVIVFTALASARAHHARGAVVWPAVARLVPGVLAGGLIGAVLADAMGDRTLQATFGAFVIIITLYIVLGYTPPAVRRLPGMAATMVAGVVIGTVSALAGIGGGVMTVPFMLWSNTPLHKAVGTAAACTLPVALAGAIGFAWTGWDSQPSPDRSTGYILWPAVIGISIGSMAMAPAGAWLAHSLPVIHLRRAFAILLMFVGARMLLG